MIEVKDFFKRQLSEWEMVRTNFSNLGHIRERDLDLHGISVRVQYNPERIRSTAVKTDQASISSRKCFLCLRNLPEEQQVYHFDFTGKYVMLVNPYPIFPIHFTLPDVSHTKQAIRGRFSDLLDFASELASFVVFYNGPYCGASAPDHAHFQAGGKGFLPLEKDFDKIEKQEIYTKEGLQLFSFKNYLCEGFVFLSSDKEKLKEGFEELYRLLPTIEGRRYEPMMNILVWKKNNTWICCVFPRTKHRPARYFEDGEHKILLSPASVELGGVVSLPREEDFQKISSRDIEEILSEVCIDSKMKNDIVNKL